LSGDRARSDLGQLALLDAMVFFAAAILLSSIALSFSFDSAGTFAGGNSRVDAGEVLTAFLHASIAESFEIVLDEPVTVTGGETFALCLSLEASIILGGGSAEPFRQMNEIVGRALSDLCPAGFSPSLVVAEKSTGLGDPLFVIPGAANRSEQVYAASAWIPSANGEELLVVLMLAPTLLAEVASI